MAGLARQREVLEPNHRAMSKPTVILTRNVSSPLVIGTGIMADAPDDRIGTGGANLESAEIHSTRPSWVPGAYASTSALYPASGPRRLERIAA